MIEEGYVSFDTARMLKEVGFEANLKTRYVEEEKDEWAFWDSGMKRNDYNYFDDTIACPTQALAARWLCEHKMIEVSTAYCRRRKSWYYWVGYLDCKDEDVTFGFDYASRQYAMEAGLQEAIKLIKK